MKFALNVISSTLALAAVSAFMAACSSQDTMQGRTYTKAQAQKFFAKYSDDELQQYCAKDENVKTCADLKLLPTKKTTTVTPTVQNGTQTPAAPGAPVPPSAPAAPGQPAPAKAKTIVPDAKSEQENPIQLPQVGAQNKAFIEYAIADDLIKKNNEALAGAVNAFAAKFAQGVNILLNPTATGLSLGIDAAVFVDNEKMNLFVTNAPISFSEDGKVQAIPFVLKDLTGEEKDPKNLVKVTAICVDKACDKVQVRIDFLFADNKTVPAVYMLTKESGYTVVATNVIETENLAKLPTFESARGENPVQRPALKAPVAAPAAAPAPEKAPVVQAAPKGTTPKAEAPADKTPKGPANTATPKPAADVVVDSKKPFTFTKVPALVDQVNAKKPAAQPTQLAKVLQNGAPAKLDLLPKTPVTASKSVFWQAKPVAVAPAAAKPAAAAPAPAAQTKSNLPGLTSGAGISAAQMKASLAAKPAAQVFKPISSNSGVPSMMPTPATPVKPGPAAAPTFTSIGATSALPLGALQPQAVIEASNLSTNNTVFNARSAAAKKHRAEVAAAAEKAKADKAEADKKAADAAPAQKAN